MTTTEAAVKRQRNFASGVTLSAGLLNLQVDLVPRSRPSLTRGTGLHVLCNHPDHDEPVPCSQRYQCEDGHISKEGDLPLGGMVEGHGRVAVPRDDLTTAVLGEHTAKLAELQAHPAEQIEAATVPNGTGYRVRAPKDAGPKHIELLATLTAVIEAHPEIAWVSEIVLRNSRGFYRLTTWRGQLIVQGLTHTYELAEPVPEEALDGIDVPDKDRAALEAFLTGEVTDYDPDTYWRDVPEVAAQLLTERANDPTPAAATGTDDPMAEIRAAVEPAKKKKAVKKKAAAKRKATKKKQEAA